MIRKSMATLMMVALGMGIAPVQAAINGWFDAIYVSSVDHGYGWICESTAPNTVPPGNLAFYINGPAGGGGTLWQENPVSFYWGYYRPDVPAAGFCGSNTNAGWEMFDWIPTPIYAYYRDTSGNLQLLGGSPKTCSGIGWCY